MTRKRCHRRIVVPVPPRGLRPKLRRDQVIDLGIVHAINLDTIAKGQATPDLLWDLVESVLCWSHVAELTGQGIDEMTAQIHLTTRMIDRYRNTGRVGFSGADYQLAKHGLDVMDALAETVDQHTAMQASTYSMLAVARLAADATTLRQAA